MSGDLELQREILAAVKSNDTEALRAIAVREGIDPALWDYWLRQMELIENLSKGLPVVVTDSTLIEGRG
jgi:hypothetical protein